MDRVTLFIEQGERVAILGPNGCGKSSFVKLIDRELYPAFGSGEMRILGQSRWDVSALRATLGIVTNDLQYSILPETLVTDVVIAGFTGKLGRYWDEATAERVRKAEESLALVGASHLADREFGTLSSGEGRRILIARALAHGPRTLLLDEPTTSLDLVSAHFLMKTIRDLGLSGRGLVLVTHHLEEIIPEIERVILLREGRILMDGPRSEAMTEPHLTELFQTPIRLKGDGPYSAEVAT